LGSSTKAAKDDPSTAAQVGEEHNEKPVARNHRGRDVPERAKETSAFQTLRGQELTVAGEYKKRKIPQSNEQ